MHAKTRGMHAPIISQALFNPDLSSLHETYAHGPLLSLQGLKFNVNYEKLKQALKIKSQNSSATPHPTALLPSLPVAVAICDWH